MTDRHQYKICCASLEGCIFITEPERKSLGQLHSKSILMKRAMIIRTVKIDENPKQIMGVMKVRSFTIFYGMYISQNINMKMKISELMMS